MSTTAGVGRGCSSHVQEQRVQLCGAPSLDLVAGSAAGATAVMVPRLAACNSDNSHRGYMEGIHCCTMSDALH